jgi:hypothetical protein
METAPQKNTFGRVFDTHRTRIDTQIALVLKAEQNTGIPQLIKPSEVSRLLTSKLSGKDSVKQFGTLAADLEDGDVESWLRRPDSQEAIEEVIGEIIINKVYEIRRGLRNLGARDEHITPQLEMQSLLRMGNPKLIANSALLDVFTNISQLVNPKRNLGETATTFEKSSIYAEVGRQYIRFCELISTELARIQLEVLYTKSPKAPIDTQLK